MSDTPETLAAILAEMRSARNAESDLTLVLTDWLTQWADRIEAAAKRERDEDRQLAAIAESDEAFARCARCDRPERAPNNAAAMRESIETMRRYAMLPQEELSISLLQRTIHEKCDAALSAPARNCDRFATAEEAVAAFADHLRAWENAHGICSEYPDHAVKVPAGAFAWLFAKAEGGDHA